jgi:hypothetical protein
MGPRTPLADTVVLALVASLQDTHAFARSRVLPPIIGTLRPVQRDTDDIRLNVSHLEDPGELSYRVPEVRRLGVRLHERAGSNKDFAGGPVATLTRPGGSSESAHQHRLRSGRNSLRVSRDFAPPHLLQQSDVR